MDTYIFVMIVFLLDRFYLVEIHWLQNNLGRNNVINPFWEVWAFVRKSYYQKNQFIYTVRCARSYFLESPFFFSHLKFQFDYDDKSSSSHSNNFSCKITRKHRYNNKRLKIHSNGFLFKMFHSLLMINYDKILVYSSFFSAAAFPFGIIANTFSDTSSNFPFTWSKTGSIWALLFK